MLVLIALFVLVVAIFILFSVSFSADFLIAGHTHDILAYVFIISGLLLSVFIYYIYKWLKNKNLMIYLIVKPNPKLDSVNQTAESNEQIQEESYNEIISYNSETPSDLTLCCQDCIEHNIADKCLIKNNMIELELYKNVLGSIREQIEINEIYLDRELNYTEFSKVVGQPYNIISAIIHHYYQASFSQVINKFRVEYAINLLEDRTNDNLKIEYIGWLSGFKSRSTFYHAFAGIKGDSPANFRENRKKKFL